MSEVNTPTVAMIMQVSSAIWKAWMKVSWSWPAAAAVIPCRWRMAPALVPLSGTWKERLILGREMFTMLASRVAIKTPMATIPKTVHFPAVSPLDAKIASLSTVFKVPSHSFMELLPTFQVPKHSATE